MCFRSGVGRWRHEPDNEILRRLLNHVNQRFRFSYVLGNGPVSYVNDFNDADEELGEEKSGSPSDAGFKATDLSETNKLLIEIVAALKEIAGRQGTDLREKLGATNDLDERVVDELFEEEFDNLIRDDEQFHGVVDDLLDEIEKRFDLLDPTDVRAHQAGMATIMVVGNE